MDLRPLNPSLMCTAVALALLASPAPAGARDNGTAAIPARSFEILWRAPRHGSHRLEVFTQDRAGRHLAFAKDCRSGQSVRADFTARGARVGVFLYDNGLLVKRQYL